MTTTDRRGVTGSRAASGYWTLRPGDGEAHLLRGELAGSSIGAFGEPLLTIGHLSDLHVCDSQSPARAEFLDRWADDDAPTKAALVERNGSGLVGTYRAQDALTAQVAEMAVRAVNGVANGPVGGAPLDLTVVTGDVTDNAQANELAWYTALLEGGPVRPDSGSPKRYEGVGDHQGWDEAFWHPDPEGHGPDRPRRLHGFPDAPGLLDALREPFEATGLAMPWLAVHGNHDQMIQGTIPSAGALGHVATAAVKAVGVPASWSTADVLGFLAAVDECRPQALTRWADLVTRRITPDAARRTISRAEFVAAHWGERARPTGHGFTDPTGDRATYRYDHGRVSIIVLDTVNEHGGWQGSLDADQLAWLDEELAQADRERRYVVLASHHPLVTLVNGSAPVGAAPRMLGAQVESVLREHPSVVLWLNGHTHASTVTAHGGPGDHPWWEVTTPSLIDFPQQGRVVELLRGADGTLTIAATMVDHAGELPWSGSVTSVAAMAGLSRELAANDWQLRCDDLGKHVAVGTPGDRNVLLQLPDPFGR